MCVAITLAPGTVLTKDEVVRMNRANADGVGVAWARQGVVQWYKTTKVDPEYITNMVEAWKDHPRLVHFRLATAGGTRPDLCHPFEVGPLANCKVTGSSTKVMIHNGHWGRWSEVHSLLEKEGLLPDKGPWSDSRLAAYLAHHDPEWLAALGGRVAVMTGDGRTERIGSWEELRGGIQVSNKNWATNYQYTKGGYAGYRAWKGWSWDEDEYEAFFAEKEARAAEAAAELEDLDKKVEAAIEGRTRSYGKSKKERRDERRARAGAASATCAVQTERSPDACATPDCAPNSCATPETRGAPASAEVGVRNYTDKPFQAKSGKWYRVVTTRGYREVVEIAAPSA